MELDFRKFWCWIHECASLPSAAGVEVHQARGLAPSWLPKAGPAAMELLMTVKTILKSPMPYTSFSLSWKEMDKEGVGWLHPEGCGSGSGKQDWGSLGCGDWD